MIRSGGQSGDRPLHARNCQRRGHRKLLPKSVEASLLDPRNPGAGRTEGRLRQKTRASRSTALVLSGSPEVCSVGVAVGVGVGRSFTFFPRQAVFWGTDYEKCNEKTLPNRLRFASLSCASRPNHAA